MFSNATHMRKTLRINKVDDEGKHLKFVSHHLVVEADREPCTGPCSWTITES